MENLGLVEPHGSNTLRTQGSSALSLASASSIQTPLPIRNRKKGVPEMHGPPNQEKCRQSERRIDTRSGRAPLEPILARNRLLLISHSMNSRIGFARHPFGAFPLVVSID